MRLYVRLLIGVLRRSMRAHRDLLMENLVLRQQIAVYARQPKRPRLLNEDRLFRSMVARTWSPWRSRLRLVQPETVVGGQNSIVPVPRGFGEARLDHAPPHGGLAVPRRGRAKLDRAGPTRLS